MHPRLLEYYEKELSFLRGMGKEFAGQFPGVAQRLDIGRFECADPYVERLLEGFAFLAARIQLKIDAEFPDFTQYLLNIVYPHYLSPVPSMTIMRFEADLDGGVTEAGFRLPKGTQLFSDPLPKGAQLFSDPSAGGQSRCEFRTARDVNLWSVKLISAEYLSAAEAGYYPDARQQVRSGLRLRLQACGGIVWHTLPLDELVFYLDGARETSGRVYELLAAHTLSVVVQPAPRQGGKPAWNRILPASAVQPLGFAEEEALLPYTEVSFQGYRLLQEYYAFPERFLFIQLKGLQPAIRRMAGEDTLELVFLFRDKNELLRGVLGTDNFVLNCAPAINLFPRKADPFHVSSLAREQHVIVDRTHAQDYEVYSITDVTGYDSNRQIQQRFRPFYDCRNGEKLGNAYYTWRRIPHLPPAGKPGRNYQSSEVYLSLVDSASAPYAADLKQLGVNVLCTNRDAPLYAYQSKGRVSFTLEASAPVKRVESLAGPTPPRPAYPEGERAWRLISHLSLNYLSLLDNDEQQGAAALRELLRLYADTGSVGFKKQVEGILSVSSRPVVRRIPGAGPIAFGRGVEIALQCRDSAFDGLGAFLLGSVLEKFFAKYVSINSFTQMSLKTVERGEVMQWPVRTGTTPIL